MKVRFVLVTGFVSLAALVVVGASWSQQPANPATRGVINFAGEPIAGADVRIPPTSVNSAQQRIGIAQKKVHELVAGLKGAEDAKKADLMKRLETEISSYFDVDFEFRTTELKKLEERVSRLRTQLDRRREAKGEIIQLELKMLVNRAEGLGLGESSEVDPRSWRGDGANVSAGRATRAEN